MTDLFRREAVDFQQQRLLGTIILRQPWPSLALTALFGLLLAGLLAVFFLFGFARRETLTGRLLPEGGLIQTRSAQPGLVQECLVQEGQAVQAGDLLFVLSGERQGARGPTLARVATALRGQRELLRADLLRAQQQSALSRLALELKLGQLRVQSTQVQAGIRVQQQRVALVQAAHQRHSQLQASGAVSRPDVEARQAEALEQESRLHALLRDEAALSAEREAIQADLRALPTQLQRELAAIEGQMNSLSQSEAENDTRQRWELRAPRAGHVTVLAVEPGQSVLAGELLASLAPAGAALEAVLYAPSRAAGQLKTGMPALLRFDALPYQKFGQFAGQILAVSRSPVPPGELWGRAELDATQGSPRYRVRVRLDGSGIPAELAASLKPGMQLDATVTLEQRRFYEWVLEPLLGLQARL